MNSTWVGTELYQLLLVALLFVQCLSPRLQKPRVENWLPVMAGLGVVLALLNFNVQGEILSRAYRIDRLSQFFKILVCMGFAVAVLNARRQPSLIEKKRPTTFF